MLVSAQKPRYAQSFLDSPPIHDSLNSLDFQGPHARVLEILSREGEGFSCIDHRGDTRDYSKKDKVQSVLLRSLAPSFSDAELGVMFAKKLVVTLGEVFSSTCRVSSLWFSELKPFLESCTVLKL